MHVSATDFRANSTKLLDHVATTHQRLVVTKYGKPIAQVIPVDTADDRSAYGYLKGTITIHGNIVTPIDEPSSHDRHEKHRSSAGEDRSRKDDA